VTFLKSSAWIKIIIILILGCVYIFIKPVQVSVKQIIFILSTADVTALKGYILSFGIYAPITSFFLMVFQSVIAPLPAFVITFANAALFWVD